jgi:hypothetical protein
MQNPETTEQGKMVTSKLLHSSVVPVKSSVIPDNNKKKSGIETPLLFTIIF